jgi:Flagellar hook-length control protein FliK
MLNNNFQVQSAKTTFSEAPRLQDEPRGTMALRKGGGRDFQAHLSQSDDLIPGSGAPLQDIAPPEISSFRNDSETGHDAESQARPQQDQSAPPRSLAAKMDEDGADPSDLDPPDPEESAGRMKQAPFASPMVQLSGTGALPTQANFTATDGIEFFQRHPWSAALDSGLIGVASAPEIPPNGSGALGKTDSTKLLQPVPPASRDIPESFSDIGKPVNRSPDSARVQARETGNSSELESDLRQLAIIPISERSRQSSPTIRINGGGNTSALAATESLEYFGQLSFRKPAVGTSGGNVRMVGRQPADDALLPPVPKMPGPAFGRVRNNDVSRYAPAAVEGNTDARANGQTATTAGLLRGGEFSGRFSWSADAATDIRSPTGIDQVPANDTGKVIQKSPDLSLSESSANPLLTGANASFPDALLSPGENLPTGISGLERVSPTGTTAFPDAAVFRADAARLPVPQLAEIMVRQADRKIEIALNPEELGRVRMALSKTESGVMVQIFAERPETIELMRRHIDQLAQEFRRLGYDDVGFEFHGGGAESFRQSRAETEQTSGGASEDFAPEPVHLLRSSARAPSTGLDIRL